MGVSTNGMIAFGVPCGGGVAFPWDAKPFDGDIHEWWRAENGFVDVHEPWDALGNYKPGWDGKDPRVDEYFEARRKWDKENPLPVGADNYCSDGCPMWAIVLPDAGLSCRRGYPETIDVSKLTVEPEQVEALKAFMSKYGIVGEGEPRWLLMSYWSQ